MAELRGRIREDVATLESLNSAWKTHVATMTASFANRMRGIVSAFNGAQKDKPCGAPTPSTPSETSPTTVPPAKERLALLLQLAELCDKSSHNSVLHFPVTDPSGVANVLVQSLRSPSEVLRCAALYAMSWLVADVGFLQSFYQVRGHWPLAYILDKTGERYDRQQASRVLTALVNAMTAKAESDTPSAMPSLPCNLITRIISVAEGEDKPNVSEAEMNPRQKAAFQHDRNHAVAMLRDLMWTSTASVSAANGVEALMRFCLDPSSSCEQTDTIVDKLLTVFEDPHKRAFLHIGDLSLLFSPFLELYVKDPKEHMKRMLAAKRAITRCLQKWSGLMWVATERVGLRALVDVLNLPGPEPRKMVLLDLFNTVIRQAAPQRGIPDEGPWNTGPYAPPPPAGCPPVNNSSVSSHLSVPAGDSGSQAADEFELVSSELPASAALEHTLLDTSDDATDVFLASQSVGYHAMDPFLSALLMLLDSEGLPKALMSIIRSSSGDALPQGAAQLLQHVLVLMDTVLAREYAESLHATFNSVIAKLHHEQDSVAGAMTTKLFYDVTYSSRQGAADISASMVAGSASSMAVDDVQFQQMVKDSHVEQYSEWPKWNFDIISNIIQGPLRQIARLRWVHNNTRFLVKTLAFYKPGKTGFAQVRREESQAVPGLTAVGVRLLDVLLSTKDGVDILERSEYVKGIHQMLHEVLTSAPQPLLMKEKISTTMIREYFRYVGRLSSNPSGLLLLQKYGVFETIAQLFKALLDGSESQPIVTPPSSQTSPSQPALPLPPPSIDLAVDVCHQLLQHINFGCVPNYGVSQEARDILALALRSSRNPIRLCAVSQLTKVMYKDLSGSMEWGVQRALERLVDPFISVSDGCFKTLDTVCAASVDALNYLISCQPKVLLNLPAAINSTTLLLRILGRPAGFAFLHAAGWIEQQTALWESKGSVTFLHDIEELSIPRSQSIDLRSPRGSMVISRRPDSDSNGGATRPRARSIATISVEETVPLSFVGELCRTDDGAAYFAHTGIFLKAVESVMTQSVFSGDCDLAETARFPEGEAQSPAAPSAASQDFSFDAPLRADNVTKNIQELIESEDLLYSDVLASRSSKQQSSKVKRNPAAQSVLLSAARGYTALNVNQVMRCSGDVEALRAAVLTLGHAAASTSGFEVVVSRHPDALLRILQLAEHAPTPQVRGCALVAVSVIARCEAGRNFLSASSFVVYHNTNAYISIDNVGFSVGFAHPKSQSWLAVPFARAHIHAPRLMGGEMLTFECESRDGTVQSIFKYVKELVNPVIRETAKMELHKRMKANPELFLRSDVQQLVLQLTNTHHLRLEERRFLVTCLSLAEQAVRQQQQQPEVVLHLPPAAHGPAAQSPQPQAAPNVVLPESQPPTQPLPTICVSDPGVAAS